MAGKNYLRKKWGSVGFDDNTGVGGGGIGWGRKRDIRRRRGWGSDKWDVE